MQLKDSYYIPLKEKALIFLLMFFVISIYPLVYQIYADNGLVGSINKYILFLLLFLFFFRYRSFVLCFSHSKENRLLGISLIYMAASLMIYSPNMNISDVIREILYVFVPIVFYVVLKDFDVRKQSFFLDVIIYSLLVVIFVGVLNLFGIVLPIANMKDALTHHGLNFQSYYSAMQMGYVIQLLFAITLFDVSNNKLLKRFRMLLLFVFVLLGLLTLQRGCYMGLLFAIVFFLYSKIKRNTIFTRKKKMLGSIKTVIFILCMILFIINLDDIMNLVSKLMGVNIESFIFDEFNSFNINSVVSDRSEQSVISNLSNPFYLFFGEGFGKYSPNNFLTTRKMPDASFYRIFDELGIIGFVIFFMPYSAMILDSIKRKRVFTLYFIIETFVAFFFNRILWMIPLNFIIYSLMGISTADKSCLYYAE